MSEPANRISLGCLETSTDHFSYEDDEVDDIDLFGNSTTINELPGFLRSLCPNSGKYSFHEVPGCCALDLHRCNPCTLATSLEMAAARSKNASMVGGGDGIHTLWSPGEMESYVKLAVSCYNQTNPDRQIDIKTFNQNLNSSTMCSLVAFLLKELDESFNNEPQTSTLPEFEQLGLTSGQYVYDSTVEHIFIEASKYFNLADNVLHMGLLLCPEKDIKRAKHVISWLAAYVLFLDNFGETFQRPYEDMMNEIEKKAELYNEIEEIKNDIANCIVESQQRQDSLPEIEKELKDIEEATQTAQSELYKLEAVASKEKANYDAMAQEVRTLEEKLRGMDMEKAALEDQLVHSAADVLHTHAEEKKKLNEATLQRTELGRELQELMMEEQKSIHLMDRMKFSLENFEGLMAFVNKAGEAVAAVNKAGNDLQIKHKEREEIKQEIRSFQEEVSKLKSELIQKSHQAVLNHRALTDAIKRINEEQENTNFCNLELQGEIQELESQTTEIKKEIQATVAKIYKYKDFFENYQQKFDVSDELEDMEEVFGIKDKPEN